jgi:L-arginine dehydrogenase
MHVLTAQRVAELLPQIDVVAAMRALFESMAQGAVVQQPQVLTVLPGGSDAGDFITYTAALSDPQVFGAKLSPYLPHSTGDKVTAWTLLMSSADGMPLLLCDAMALTVERTAATTALAVDLLASREPQALAVIGSGPVALAHLRHAAALRPWSGIRCWSPSAASRAEAIEAALPGTRIASSLEEAVQGARVVLLCTSSATPVLDPRKLDSGTLVTSISTNAPGAHEVPAESLPALDVYCDYAATTPGTAPEMKNARDFGWSEADLAGDLATLVTGAAKAPGRTAYFRSVGLGCEDIAIAAALLTCLKRQEGR